MNSFDVIIIGAGAAGLMCAAVAGQRGKRVLVLEHADEVGKKILISGGGRCNFTNLNVLPKCYISKNTHFAKSALSRYTQHEFIAMVARYGIAYHEKTLGQLFCDGSARAIVAMLLAECALGQVDVRTQHSITNIAHADGMFSVSTNHGAFTAENLVLATGGPAIPKMGATGFAYDVARQFGHKIVEPRPALVPLTTPPALLPFVQGLAGIAVEAVVGISPHCHPERSEGSPRVKGSVQGDPSLKLRMTSPPTFRENILFTHRGFSGPAILQISSYWRHGDSITMDMLPNVDVLAYLKTHKQSRPKVALKTILAQVLPARLAQALAEQYTTSPMATFSDKALAAIAEQIQRFQFTPSGSEGFNKAEVTIGGIDTDGFSSQTMESRTMKGLYAIGEAMDVTGWLGGYNFQWAWSSGWVAGHALST